MSTPNLADGFVIHNNATPQEHAAFLAGTAVMRMALRRRGVAQETIAAITEIAQEISAEVTASAHVAVANALCKSELN